jgi:hypothetical protein
MPSEAVVFNARSKVFDSIYNLLDSIFCGIFLFRPADADEV